MEHGLVVLDLLLPADQDASEAVHPGMGPLNYASPGRGALDFTLGPHFLTPRLHLEHISPSPAKSPDLLKVKTLIKAEVLRGLFGERGIVVDYASKCALCKLQVVHIGSIYRTREWNAACLSEQTALGTALGPVSGIGTCTFSPPTTPLSWPHPLPATPSRARSSHRRKRALPARFGGRVRLCSTPGSGRVPYFRLQESAGLPSTGFRCEVRSRLHSWPDDHPSVDVRASSSGLALESAAQSSPRVHPGAEKASQCRSSDTACGVPPARSTAQPLDTPWLTRVHFSDRLLVSSVDSDRRIQPDGLSFPFPHCFRHAP